MGFRKDLKALYEAHMKQVRDRYARDEYVYDEGVAAGEERGRNEGKIEGKIEGKSESILQFLEDLGEVSPQLRERIMEQKDVEILGEWLKLAAKAQTMEAFERMINNE